MIANLPKELLWTDKKDIKDFKSDMIFNSVESALSLINMLKSEQLDGNTKLRIYNEAFYLSTRVVYEHDDKANPEAYIEKIMTDLGDKELADHVIRLMFLVLLLQSDRSKEIEMFTEKLQKQYLHSIILRIVNHGNRVIKPTEKRGDCVLRPCPYSADKLQKIQLDWLKITQFFSKHIIIELLDLWDSEDEKGKVIRLIEQAYMSLLAVTKEDEAADKADEDFFEQQKTLYKVTNDEKDVNAVEDKLFKDDINKEYAREKVKDLVQEFYRGEDKNLALIEIVLCKRDVIKNFNKHKTFVKNLKNWGKLPKKQNKENNQDKTKNADEVDTARIANNMSSELYDLKNNKKVEDILKYEEWSKELNERKICISIENKLAQLMNWKGKV